MRGLSERKKVGMAVGAALVLAGVGLGVMATLRPRTEERAARGFALPPAVRERVRSGSLGPALEDEAPQGQPAGKSASPSTVDAPTPRPLGPAKGADAPGVRRSDTPGAKSTTPRVSLEPLDRLEMSYLNAEEAVRGSGAGGEAAAKAREALAAYDAAAKRCEAKVAVLLHPAEGEAARLFAAYLATSREAAGLLRRYLAKPEPAVLEEADTRSVEVQHARAALEAVLAGPASKT